jgi:LmbE family N-acetylglucosaminyl deacetylase
MKPARPPGPPVSTGRVLSPLLPAWQRPLAVVAHPDDETFGLGALLSQLARAGASVHILCFTHGEASTLNENRTDLLRQREHELRQASAALGAAGITLLGYGDGGLAAQPPGDLADRVIALAARHHPDGLLAFDDTGVTGHPDHQAATAAAVLAGTALALPVLGWALPAGVADRLRAETGQPFAGQPPARLDFRIPVDRACQREAAWLHASQISPAAVLWRRLDLQGDTEHLRWLLPPGGRR